MCIVYIKILFAQDSTSFVSKQTTRAGRFFLSCKKSSKKNKFTMCLPKNHHIVVLSAILIFVLTTEASPVGNLDPIETALVENCLKNCEICENNFTHEKHWLQAKRNVVRIYVFLIVCLLKENSEKRVTSASSRDISSLIINQSRCKLCGNLFARALTISGVTEYC